MNGATYLIALSIALVVSAQEPRKLSGPPKIDHILVEVADLEKSIAFYRDFLGLEIRSQSKNFAMLESANVGVFLSTTHWDWDEKRPSNARPGWGMYPLLKLLMWLPPWSARGRRDTKSLRSHGNIPGERKHLWLIPTATFGRSSTRRNRMKLWILLIVLGLIFVSAAARVHSQTGENVDVRAGINHDEFDRLLKKYVNEQGLVNYGAWKQKAADLSALDKYLEQFAAKIDNRAQGNERADSVVNAFK